MYTCQRATAWHFSCLITWPNLTCLPEREQRRQNLLGLSNNIWLEDKLKECSVSHPSLVSRTCLATHFITDTRWGTVFERPGTLEELEIQYSQALTKSKRETISHDRIFQALTFKATRIYRYNPLNRNINSTTTIAHRTTVHMWRWFNSSGYFVRLLWPCSCSYESQKTLSEF